MSVEFDVEAMRGVATEASVLLKVLANADRLMLLCQLSEGEHSVGELEEALDLRQPSLSQQLGVLREAGVVQTRREGRNVHYRISSPQAMAIMAALYDQLCAPRRRARAASATRKST